MSIECKDFYNPKAVLEFVKDIKSSNGKDRVQAIEDGLDNLETILHNHQTIYLYDESPEGVNFFINNNNYVNSAIEFFKLFNNNEDKQKLRKRFLEVLQKLLPKKNGILRFVSKSNLGKLKNTGSSSDWLLKFISKESHRKVILDLASEKEIREILGQIVEPYCNREDLWNSNFDKCNRANLYFDFRSKL
jgi:hypothetical protein